ESYCRSAWNAVDGFLVLLSLVDISVFLASTTKTNMLGILKVLRMLRAMRPLRVIKRAPKLKLALFKGKFFYCLGQDTINITNKSECLSANYRWVQKVYNFDSLPQALMSLFVMYSKDGWVNIVYDGLDAVGVDQQPITNYNEWMLIFFITFMVMSLFLLDMFIGVMVETFHQCQQNQNKVDEVLTEQAT
ncbi:hypothetical protein FQN60_011499, partial [Etheostoma spectabile]